jgi:predicted ATPase/class 3 adenylate cyclase
MSGDGSVGFGDGIVVAFAAAYDMRMGPMRRVELPVGVVTLLFSDIEGSTRLLREVGAAFEELLAEHDRVLRTVWSECGGVEVRNEGDAFFVAFADPARAVEAATAAQRALREQAWPAGSELRVRMGVHTGSPRVRDDDYWGVDVHYAARLCAAANGGQVLLSESTAALVDVAVEDLGEHALKDFPSARRIFHLPTDGRGSEGFPLPRTLTTGRTNLPDQLSSFVGRERELLELRMLLAHSRLVTLTGPGGVGKTRLALRLGAELLDGSGGGVWFVDLAPVLDPRLVALTVAAGLRVPVPANREVLEALHEALGDRRLLVVLDNCEQVVESAAELVAGLLTRCPGVSVLATSREPLRFAGEQVYRVPPLSTPQTSADPAELAESEAVQLFLERAAEQRCRFALNAPNAPAIARVCRRLDGIPLAIELAAVRLRSMTIDDLDARLDHRFALLTGGSRTSGPRQRTLQALIDWSYRLLTDAERNALARLSVFAASGFDLAAAEAVCGVAGASPFETLDHLDALVDKSLVQADDSSGTVRYRLLETVREYAAARLAERGEAEAANARLAHRDHYLTLAEMARPHLTGPDARQWHARLSAEHDNMRVALAESLHDADPEPGLRLATALAPFWRARGHAIEGGRMLRAQLERAEARQPTLQRGYALHEASDLLECVLGDYPAAMTCAEEALAIARSQHDDRLATDALRVIAWIELRQGDCASSLAHGEEAVDIARSLDDHYLLALLLAGRGAALSNLGRDARPDLEESLELARQSGNRSLTALALGNLAYFEVLAGELDSARDRLEEALAISTEIQEVQHVPGTSTNLGFIYHLQHDRAGAVRLFTEALISAQEVGEHESIAVALLGLALTASDPETAAMLHGAADAVREQLGSALDPLEAQSREAHHLRLRTELGGNTFQTAYSTGHAYPLSEAITVALRNRPAAPRGSKPRG